MDTAIVVGMIPQMELVIALEDTVVGLAMVALLRVVTQEEVRAQVVVAQVVKAQLVGPQETYKHQRPLPARHKVLGVEEEVQALVPLVVPLQDLEWVHPVAEEVKALVPLAVAPQGLEWARPVAEVQTLVPLAVTRQNLEWVHPVGVDPPKVDQFPCYKRAIPQVLAHRIVVHLKVTPSVEVMEIHLQNQAILASKTR